MRRLHNLLLSLSLGMAAASAEPVLSPQTEVTLDIEQSSLQDALRQFSQQTGLQVFGQGVEHVTVEALRGRYVIDVALRTLLEGTDIVHSYINDRAVQLRRVDHGAAMPDAKSKQSPARSHGVPAPSGSPLEVVIVNGVADRLGFMEPTMTFSRETIDRQGASSLAELFKNVSQQPYNTDGRRASGAEYAELRGLGPGVTAVLINNLPVAASSGDGADGFDLHSIPLAAVKSVEVTADPPPAYIPSAVGGVVNIVLDSDREQTIVDFKYSAASGGAGERKFSAAGSAGQRIKGTFALEYQRRDFLLGEKRDLWRNQDYRRFGGFDYRLPTSSPGNIHSVNGRPLPGLSSSHAAIPASGGTGLTTEDFAATDGRVNLESLSRYYSLVPATQRGSAVGMAEMPVSDTVAVSGELLYTAREVTQQRNPPILSGILVPAANPYNIFGMPLVADLLLADLPPQRTITDGEFLRMAFSVRGVNGTWSWRLSAVNTSDDVSVTSFASIPEDRVAAALSTPDPAHSLNVFSPGSPGSRELLDWLVDEPTTARSSSDTTLVRATLTGQIGKTDVLFGADGERTRSSFAEIAQQTLERSTAAAFTELRVPLHSSLQLNAGARIDHLADLGDLTGFQFGVRWRPLDSLTVVAAYDNSDRAPTLLEMMRPRTRSESLVVDRSRRSEVRSIGVIVGGNPDLEPMRVASWSLAVTLRPESGFYELGAKYWNISLRDQVLVPSLPRLLDHEEFFSERVVRDPPTATDIALGQPGPLRLLDFSRINSGRLDTRGVDVLVSKRIDAGAFGQVSARLTATWVDEYVTADVPSIRGTDRAGIASPYGTIPRWRAIASLEWQGSIVGMSANARFIPAYADAFLEPTGRMLPSQTIVDLEAKLKPGLASDSALLRDLTIAFGVLNVFDKPAAFASVGYSAGYDLSQGDLLQRVGYLRVAKAF